jgi:hypothetical protein
MLFNPLGPNKINVLKILKTNIDLKIFLELEIIDDYKY